MREELTDSEISNFLQRYGKVRPLSLPKQKLSSSILPYEVENENQKFAVFVYNWKKSIGTDVLIRLEDKIADLGKKYDGIIVIGKKFSVNARDIVDDINRRGKNPLILIRRSEISMILDSAR